MRFMYQLNLATNEAKRRPHQYLLGDLQKSPFRLFEVDHIPDRIEVLEDIHDVSPNRKEMKTGYSRQV